MRLHWSVNLPTPQNGHATFTSPTGDIHMQPLTFTVPAGVKPGDYTLQLTVKFTPGGTQEDTFLINVLTPDPAPAAGGKLAIFDPPGETTRMLGALGVHGDAVQANADLAKYDLLIVGKDALTPEGPGPNLARVSEGLRVLVFEQHADVLEQRFGFRVQEYGLREVFRRIPDHPVLAGLDENLLKDWRGDATNMAPRLKYKQLPYPIINPAITSAGVTVTRPWRCGNRGNVASVLIEKPACGDFMPLVDGGYSLQYSPLMEYREGQGLVIFCQMDVTGRTGSRSGRRTAGAEHHCPTPAPWKPAAQRTILYAGGPAGRKHLQQAGFAVEPYTAGALKADRVLVVSPGGPAALAADKDAIATWLKQDGRVLALGLDSTEVECVSAGQGGNQVSRAHWHVLRTANGEFAAGRRRPGGCPQPRSAERPAGHWRRPDCGRRRARQCLGGPRGLLPDCALAIQYQAAEYQAHFPPHQLPSFAVAGQSGRPGADAGSRAFHGTGQTDRWTIAGAPLAQWILSGPT